MENKFFYNIDECVEYINKNFENTLENRKNLIIFLKDKYKILNKDNSVKKKILEEDYSNIKLDNNIVYISYFYLINLIIDLAKEDYIKY